MTTKETTKNKRTAAAYKLDADTDVIGLIERAKEAFYVDPGVVGVGVGPRRRGDDVHEDQAPSQVPALTNGDATSLHRHQIRPSDRPITGTQFTGTIQPGQTQRWLTNNWNPAFIADWSVRPTTARGRVTWQTEIELSSSGSLTYWIVIENVGSIPTGFEAKYAVMR